MTTVEYNLCAENFFETSFYLLNTKLILTLNFYFFAFAGRSSSTLFLAKRSRRLAMFLSKIGERMMRVTAVRMSTTPTPICVENCSPKTSIPIISAVRGSIAPSTEVRVDPILLMEYMSARLETSVGSRARQMRLIHAIGVGAICIPSPTMNAWMTKYTLLQSSA